MKISISDGYSPTARPNRGYHDNLCRIEFISGFPSEEEMTKIVNFFYQNLKERQYMWCYPAEKQSRGNLEWWDDAKPHVFTIRYGYDSGD